MSTAGVTTLTELFADSVRRFPDRLAVSDEWRTLTYAELDRESDAVSAVLADLGVVAEDRVALYLDRSADLVVSVLGILKAGAAYVAVDTRYPAARRDLLLTHSGARIVLADAGTEFLLDGSGLTTLTAADAALGGGRYRAAVAPGHVANVVFTSGSTGEPKGIVLEHRNLVSLATNPGLPALVAEDRMGQIASASFDGFNMEVWTALAAGAQVVLLPAVPDLLAAGFRQELERLGVTVMVAPTMVVNHVVRVDPDSFAPLRILQAGGDVLLPSACRALLDGSFRGTLHNLYGPAEITTCCTGHQVTSADADSDIVPIGLPLVGVSVHVLSPSREPVSVGEIGELYIGGPGVARGYLGRPDLTAEHFVSLGDSRVYRTGDLVRQRDDGALLFVGRIDDQVRIRGYRVEPSEVEAALRRYAGVQDAVVLTEGDGNDRSLAAFLEAGDELDLADLRVWAEHDLPDFMVPGRLIKLARLPVTAHGKRDLAALRAVLAERASEYAPPVTETERYLAALWAEMLDTERIGRTDDLFGRGGHSLLAFRMHHRINRELAIRLDYRTLLDNTVLADLAAVLDALRTRAASA